MSLPLPQLVPPTSLGPDDFTDDEFLRPATRKSGTVFGLAVGVRALGNELSKWKLHSGREDSGEDEGCAGGEVRWKMGGH